MEEENRSDPRKEEEEDDDEDNETLTSKIAQISYDPYMQSMTDKESETVCELRKILKKSYPYLSSEDTFMSPKKYPGFNQIDLSDHTLLRFIRARNGDAKKTEKMIRRAILFRKHWVTHKLVNNKIFHPIVEKFRPGGQPDWAVDRDGSPIFYDRGGQFDPRTRDVVVDNEDWLLYEIVNMEVCIAKLHKSSTPQRKHRQVTIIQDLKGLRLRAIRHKSLQDLFKMVGFIVDNNYPEYLKRCIIVNAPRIFSIFWAVFKYFFAKHTRDKVIITSGDPITVLSPFVDPANIPAYLGGKRYDGPDPNCSMSIKPGGNVPYPISKSLHNAVFAFQKAKQDGEVRRLPKNYMEWASEARLEEVTKGELSKSKLCS